MAENCGKYATASQSQKRQSGGLRGDDAKTRALMLPSLVDDLLSVIETATALRLTAETSIGIDRAIRARARSFTHFILGQGVADANNHARKDNAIATYSQLYSIRLIDSGVNRGRRATRRLEQGLRRDPGDGQADEDDVGEELGRN